MFGQADMIHLTSAEIGKSLALKMKLIFIISVTRRDIFKLCKLQILSKIRVQYLECKMEIYKKFTKFDSINSKEVSNNLKEI